MGSLLLVLQCSWIMKILLNKHSLVCAKWYLLIIYLVVPVIVYLITPQIEQLQLELQREKTRSKEQLDEYEESLRKLREERNKQQEYVNELQVSLVSRHCLA